MTPSRRWITGDELAEKTQVLLAKLNEQKKRVEVCMAKLSTPAHLVGKPMSMLSLKPSDN